MSLNTPSASTNKTNQFTLVCDHPKTTVFTIALLAALVVSSVFLKMSLDINNHDMILVCGAIACTSIAGLITIAVACLTTLRKKVIAISSVDTATTNVEAASNPVSLPTTNPASNFVSNPASSNDVISSITNRVPLSNEFSANNNNLSSRNSIDQDLATAQALQKQFDEEVALSKKVAASKKTLTSSPLSSEPLQRDMEYVEREQQRVYNEELNVPIITPTVVNRTAMMPSTISGPTSRPAKRSTPSSATNIPSESSYIPQKITPRATPATMNSQLALDADLAQQYQSWEASRAGVALNSVIPKFPPEMTSRTTSRIASAKRATSSSSSHFEVTDITALSNEELNDLLSQNVINSVDGKLPAFVRRPIIPTHRSISLSGVPEIPSYIPTGRLSSLTSSVNTSNTSTSTASSTTDAPTTPIITVPIISTIISPIVIPSSSAESSSMTTSDTMSSAPSPKASILVTPPINSQQITSTVESSPATSSTSASSSEITQESNLALALPSIIVQSSHSSNASMPIVSDASISSSSSETVKSSSSSSATDPKVIAFEAECRQKLSEGTKSFGDWINTLIARISSLTKEELMVLTSVFEDGSTIMFGWAQHYEGYPLLVGASHYSTLAARLSTRMKNLGIDSRYKEKFFGQINTAQETCITAVKKPDIRVKVERLIELASSAR